GRHCDEGRLAGGENLAGVRIDDAALGAVSPAVLVDDPALGADRAPDRDRPTERDVQPRGDAPGAAPDDRPGHDLIEQRADDAAVSHGFPALEARLEGGLGPRPAGIGVDREVEALLVELAAG